MNLNFNTNFEIARIEMDKYLVANTNDREVNAEIFTPHTLRKEMINMIPINFWSSPKKVFEPCVGKGAFLVEIIKMFMTGLQELISNPEERYKHIIEECIYFADINPINVDICKNCIDNENKYNLNYYIGNLLQKSLDINDYFQTNGFDLVITNPPYQQSNCKASGNTIYQKFIQLSLNKWCTPNGYMAFVNPPSWRKPNTKRCKNFGMYKLMCIDNQLMYLNINTKKNGMEVFGAGTRFDYYLIQKQKAHLKTTIISSLNTKHSIEVYKYEWLPNAYFDNVFELLANDNEPKCKLYTDPFYSTRKPFVSETKTNEFKHILVYTTPKSGTRYLYTSLKTDRAFFGIPKVILGRNGIHTPVNDYKAEYGIAGNSVCIPISSKQQGDQIISFLKSPEFIKIIKAISYSLFSVEIRAFHYFRDNFWIPK